MTDVPASGDTKIISNDSSKLMNGKLWPAAPKSAGKALASQSIVTPVVVRALRELEYWYE